jgi:hypothetical protein
MTYHHASWHADSEAAKQALKGPQGGKRNKFKSSSSTSSSESRNSEIDNILGVSNYGPLLGDESKSESQNNKPVKRVIMGSLSDILSGNLGGLLGNDGDDDEDEEEDDDDDDDDDDEVGFIPDSLKNGAIISFTTTTRVNKGDGDNGVDGFDIEVDDTYDDDDDDDDEDDSDALKVWTKTGYPMKKPQKTSKTSPTDRRQSCIAALRKLANEGRISAKQKRSLLTDIISCSAKGELSMVEVAYDLLCCSASDANNANQPDEDAEEEFADQCIVFAQSFVDNQ